MTERIPEWKKTVKELRARYGMSQADVSNALGISLMTYNKTIQSALKKYRDLNIKKLIQSGQVIQINDLIGKLIAEDNRVLEELRKCTINQN